MATPEIGMIPENIAYDDPVHGCHGRVVVGSCLQAWLHAGNRPEQLFSAAALMIKQSARMRTGRVVLPGGTAGERAEIFVKAYTPNVIKRWCNSLANQYRARAVWETACSLLAARISVPESLGYFVYNRGPLRGCSYYCSQMLFDCNNLRHVSVTDPSRLERLLANGFFEGFMAAIGRFHAAGFIHGDLKWTNIQIDRATDRIWFTDLDATRHRADGTTGQVEAINDVARFVADAEPLKQYDEIRARCVSYYARQCKASDARLNGQIEIHVRRHKNHR